MTIKDGENDPFQVNKVVGHLQFGTPKLTECADNVKHTEPISDQPQQSARSSEC